MPEREKAKVVPCRFASRDSKREQIAAFLREHGDDIPESVIHEATTGEALDKWVTVCDPHSRRIAGVVRWARSDWYLCTIKNAAVRKELRGKKIGDRIYRQVIDEALKDDWCLVLAGDVTFDNYPSKSLLEKHGFKVVNRFCWKTGEKPADILHYVRIPPRGWVKGAC